MIVLTTESPTHLDGDQNNQISKTIQISKEAEQNSNNFKSTPSLNPHRQQSPVRAYFLMLPNPEIKTINLDQLLFSS